MGRTSRTPGRSVLTAEACGPEDQIQQMQVFQVLKVHYLCNLVSVDGVQLLPEKLKASYQEITDTYQCR